jgi:MFS transporter, PPP family, 3-phenylpropionic acid transporter
MAHPWMPTRRAFGALRDKPLTLTQKPKLHCFLMLPYWRGTLYYLAFWGSIGTFAGFVGVRWTELGITPAQLGLLSIFGPIAGLTLAPILSRIADSRGLHREILALSLLFMGLTLMSGFFVRDFAGALLLSVVVAIFACGVGPIGDGLIARMASSNGLQFGRMRLWGSFSFASTSALFGLLYNSTGYLPMFVVCGLGLIATAPLARNLEPSRDMPLEPVPDVPLEPVPDVPLEPSKIVFDAGLVVILLVNLLIGLGLGFVGPYYGVRIDQLGGGAAQIGLFYAIIAFSELPTMQFEKRIAKRIGDAGVLLIASCLYTLAHLFYTLAPSAAWMTAAGCLQGLAFGLFFVGSVRMVDARAGKLISTLQVWRNSMLGGVAPLVGAALGGWLSGAAGIQTVFWLTTVTMLVSSLVIYATRKRL